MFPLFKTRRPSINAMVKQSSQRVQLDDICEKFSKLEICFSEQRFFHFKNKKTSWTKQRERGERTTDFRNNRRNEVDKTIEWCSLSRTNCHLKCCSNLVRHLKRGWWSLTLFLDVYEREHGLSNKRTMHLKQELTSPVSIYIRKWLV